MPAVHSRLSIEDRRKKFPLEYALKDAYVVYLRDGASPQLEATIYENLKKLAAAVIAHKYGPGNRIDVERLSHEIAASLFMTIVQRKKEVFSWTNLMKKVARDSVSNFLRKEYYDTPHCVQMDQGRPGDDEEAGNFLEHYEHANDIRPEDVLHVEQLAENAFRELLAAYRDISHLSHYLTFRMAFHEVVHRQHHPFFAMLAGARLTRYNYYVFLLQTILAPVLSAQYFLARE